MERWNRRTADPRGFQTTGVQLTEVTQRDRQNLLADRLAEEGRRDPNSAYVGKFVGIANGQVVVVADGLDEMVSRLQQIEPDPMKTFGVEVGRDSVIASGRAPAADISAA